MKYHFKIHKEGKGYWAQCIELPGVVTQADSREELEKNMHEALNLCVEEPEDSKEVAPLPDDNIKLSKDVVAVAVEPKKQKLSFEDIPGFKLHNQHELTEFKPDQQFKDFKKVAEALLECLLENDTEGYREILDSFLRVNRLRIAKNSNPKDIKFVYDEQGNKVGVLLPRKTYEKIMTAIDDYEDLKTVLKLSRKLLR